MLPPGLTSIQEVARYYDDKYYALIEAGEVNPFIYPLITFGPLFAFLFLLIDYRKSRLLDLSRYIVFAVFSIFQAWCVLTTVARNPAASYGIGIVSASAWGWVAVHLVVNDCQRDYRRLTRKKPSSPPGETSKDDKQGALLYWQPYPDGFVQRVSWVTDLFISFRGIGWNWQTGGVPEAPSWAKAQIEGKDAPPTDEMTVSKTGVRRLSSRSQLVRESLIMLALGYLALDALKTFTMHDPYFWGYTNSPAPAFYPQIVRHSPVIIRLIRLLTTMFCTGTALWTIFKLGPIFFAGILGPKIMGLSGEAWMNPPDMFGSFNNVLNKGLNGWWSGTWHQVFRYIFQAPAVRLLEILGVDKKSSAGKLMALAAAFFISGCIHATGSYTQQGDSRPTRGPFAFFVSQGLGIALETFAWDAIKSSGVKLPQSLKRLLNFSFTLGWLYFTGPLLCDDFSEGGVWAMEPVPVSLFRYLGFGPPGSGWWCWHNFFSWHNGKHWYDTGLLF